MVLEHPQGELNPRVLVDPEQISLVINNLVANAVVYTPAGGGVTVSTGKQRENDRVWATVTVADTGIGIREGDIPHIFERFYRGERMEGKEHIPGTGLGLAIVQEILDLHRGRVTVESEVGKGSTFTVWLPLAEDRRSVKGEGGE